MFKKFERKLDMNNYIKEKIMNIPFSPPDISDLEIEEVVDTLRSGWGMKDNRDNR